MASVRRVVAASVLGILTAEARNSDSGQAGRARDRASVAPRHLARGNRRETRRRGGMRGRAACLIGPGCSHPDPPEERTPPRTVVPSQAVCDATPPALSPPSSHPRLLVSRSIEVAIHTQPTNRSERAPSRPATERAVANRHREHRTAANPTNRGHPPPACPRRTHPGFPQNEDQDGQRANQSSTSISRWLS